MRFMAALVIMLMAAVTGGFRAKAAEMSPVPSAGSAFDFTFTGIDGVPLPLSAYRGKVLLVVNVASRCGFTGQYAGLEQIYENYKDRGLVVVGVPSNDFGAQEPGTNEEIGSFAADTYKATFPLTQKQVVSGASAHPLYQWAAIQPASGILTGVPRWNFHKYLIGRDGNLLGSYTPLAKPDDKGLKDAIERALGA